MYFIYSWQRLIKYLNFADFRIVTTFIIIIITITIIVNIIVTIKLVIKSIKSTKLIVIVKLIITIIGELIIKYNKFI